MTDLNPCRRCGSPAHFERSEANDSTYLGGAIVSCTGRNCRNSEFVSSSDMDTNGLTKGLTGRSVTGWDIISSQIDRACSEVVWRWNKLNAPAKPPLTEEEKRHLRHETLRAMCPVTYAPPPTYMKITGQSYPLLYKSPAHYCEIVSPLQSTYRVESVEEGFDLIWEVEKEDFRHDSKLHQLFKGLF